MPYFRRRRRRRRKRKSNFVKRVRAIARKAATEDAELKHMDQNSSQNPVSAGGQVAFITGCAEGDTDATRSGSEVKLGSISLKFQTFQNANNSTTDAMVRILLVQIYESDGANPAIASEILESDNVISLPEWNGKNRYKIWMDKTFTLINHSDPTWQSQRFMKKFIKFPRGIKTTYQGATNLVASAENNHFFLLFLCDMLDTNQPDIDWTSRVTFTDT